ncbi:stress responsive protein [Paenibacillus yonginensis]|uniref:Stress responsive protein n=1 Tax=Paenibacillus yonginensis TaxID=1462996 RepID=A0A1B1MX97_9BACL|nr:Dabb family protein [Paenibacillus yonginensis]ANS73811.1 stress responsive protein [Paenibacillus yonginensis]
MIKHIVLFKLKDRSPESVEKTYAVLNGMKGKVEQLVDLHIGKNVVDTPRSYDLSLEATFRSLEDLQGYQVHPEHKKVIEHISEVRESQSVVDYEF